MFKTDGRRKLRRAELTAIGMGVVVLTLAQPAQADAIDGTWCAPDGRSLSIEGPDLSLSSGQRLVGDYTRHSFQFVAPDGDPNAGAEVQMILLGDALVRVRVDAKNVAEDWDRCTLNS